MNLYFRTELNLFPTRAILQFASMRMVRHKSIFLLHFKTECPSANSSVSHLKMPEFEINSRMKKQDVFESLSQHMDVLLRRFEKELILKSETHFVSGRLSFGYLSLAKQRKVTRCRTTPDNYVNLHTFRL